ncbi:MAG TPA: RlmE family RNA methyltransferase [Patescibacteria group bacterium]|nr:RlmE family RNA methyltransferase [Patescibacteria group bacterium]
MSRRWLTEKGGDVYHRMAKEQGYRSRATYKLKQLDDRFQIFRGALFVLDVGAAPGGWLQLASESIQNGGLILGVDLEEIEDLGLENVKTIVGDILDENTFERIKRFFPGKIDLILSDLAPNVSGVWDMDHYRQIDLAKMALDIAKRILRRKGWFVSKVFQGSEYEAYLSEVKEAFSLVRIVKPKASRKGSAEIYVVAKYMK